ncbi:ComF family protein [Celeribacter indicus]|uniref:Competence protein F n=1 Tax=Celeribacter indicus TaxID=1208324 RepID=A0A0B5DUR0_9RHOB|nr:ComF family protein [Celeribacter indicus]AJE44965.1 competence protein F [Celeribacter indicus]SDW96065.1 comF family protein [Celeribacter indicus]
MQRLTRLIYPPQCLTCDEMVESEGRLCPSCWSRTPFIVDHPCDACGKPLIGDTQAGDLCDDCRSMPRAWSRGRAVMLYADNARGVVLRLKHGDRTDLARPAGAWLAQAAKPLLVDGMIVAPVPLHWMRLLRRRYNQSALLAQQVAKLHRLSYIPDLLRRPIATRTLDGMTAVQRSETVAGAIVFNERRRAAIAGRPVLLIDDVMTTGATLAQCANACRRAGAAGVFVAVLARVDREH